MDIQDATRRSPLPQNAAEIALDAVQWLGILTVMLVMLSSLGVITPLKLGVLSDKTWLSSNRLFLVVLSTVALLDYPAMLMVLKSILGRQAGSQGPTNLLALRLAFTTTPWVYLAVLLLKSN